MLIKSQIQMIAETSSFILHSDVPLASVDTCKELVIFRKQPLSLHYTLTCSLYCKR